jgi:microcompartment protein CcmL/EutN
MHPAVAILEFSSVAIGIQAGDAMIKRAPLGALITGTAQPGKYLVLVAGDVGSVEESLVAGRELAEEYLLDSVFLPDIHPDVVAAIKGNRSLSDEESLGVIETTTVAGIIQAADAAVKAATVTMTQIEMADGLGGKGYALFAGNLGDVQAAVEAGISAISAEQLLAQVVIAQLHEEMRQDVIESPYFWERNRKLEDK